MATARAEPSSSESKQSKIARPTKQLDRLSNLPEAILYYILSFVSTIEVVRTSLLAKKWRYIWTQTPNLHFDDTRFLIYNRADAFVNFVNGVHSLHKAPRIERYTVLIRYSRNTLFVDDWVRFALQMNVCELKVKVKDSVIATEPFEMPCTRSIRDMNLQLGRRDIILNDTGRFSSLENLILSHVMFDGDTIFNAISNRCPLLRSLRFKKCVGLNCLDLNLPLLEDLVIYKCDGLDRLSVSAEKLRHLCVHDSFSYGSSSVNIFAPYLQSFDWLDYIVGKFCLGNFTCLKTARISLVVDSIPQKQGLYLKNATKLLNTLACAGSLTVQIACFWSLSSQRTLFEGLAAPPHNIKHMKLFVGLDPDVYRGITYFFKSCPNLETLQIRTIDEQTYTQLKRSFPNSSVFVEGENLACPYQSQSMDHLQTVDVSGFRGEEHEIEFVGFLLRISGALKRMTILFAREVNLSQTAKISINRRVIHFKRASTDVILRIA